jgi:Mg2+ and Co2+ transporter CorA
MKSMGAVQPELSETEKTEIIKRGVIENFNVYKRGGLLLDAGNISYNFLKERGLITLTEAKKTEIIQNVKSKLRTEALQNKGSKTMQKAIDENVTTVAINIECKREALKEYFKNLVEMEIDINDLI